MKKENKLVCEFCKSRDAVGVYATDHGPFSCAYCEICLKHPNIRTLYNSLSKWARLGDVVFDEYKESNGGYEPNVFFKREYMSLRKLVNIITVEDVDNEFNFESNIVDLIKNKIEEKNIQK